MLPNEVFALECLARYAKEGLDVKQGGVHDGYPDEFAHCPYPKGMGNDGHYLTFFDHQKQGLLQSVDVGRKCYYNYKVLLYFDTWPPGCFELWDIYDQFNSGEHHSQHNRTGALCFNSKAIVAIEPDGTERHYGSIREASRDLGMDDSHLCSRYLNLNKQPKRGKWKGYQFFYAVKE